MTTLTELEKLIEGATGGPWYFADGTEVGIDRMFVAGSLDPEFKGGNVICRIENMVIHSPLTKEDEANGRFITLSRTALPNALRVIAECKAALDGLFSFHNSNGEMHNATDRALQALALIAAFDQDVTQQEKM